MTNDYGLLKVHEAELKMLKELDAFCRENGIEYILDSGTLLGAIREHGFIPWDDDVDIVMTGENFERFKRCLAEKRAAEKDSAGSGAAEKAPADNESVGNVTAENAPADMQLIGPHEYAAENKFYDFAYKLTNTQTGRREDSADGTIYDEKLNHLWIDVFAYENIPDGKLAAAFTVLRHRLLYLLALGHRDVSHIKTSALMKALTAPFRLVGSLIPMEKLCAHKDRLSKKDREKQTNKYFVPSYQPDWLQVWYDKDWYKEIIRVPFEDTLLPVPAGYDAMLTAMYGDYRKRPEERDRVASHGTCAGYRPREN